MRQIATVPSSLRRSSRSGGSRRRVVPPIDVLLAFLPASKTYWAVTSSSATPQTNLRVRIGLQDGASTVFFMKRAGARWKIVTAGPRCYEMLRVPQAVRVALGLEASCAPPG